MLLDVWRKRVKLEQQRPLTPAGEHRQPLPRILSTSPQLQSLIGQLGRTRISSAQNDDPLELPDSSFDREELEIEESQSFASHSIKSYFFYSPERKQPVGLGDAATRAPRFAS